MTIRTIPAASKTLCILLFGLLCSGCIASTAPQTPAMSQIQVRQMQSREFTDVRVTEVMKALIAALQDEGFIINNADAGLGLISAAQEREDLDVSAKNWAEFANGSGAGNYRTARRYDASATVHQHGSVIRVRINIVEKSISNQGGTLQAHPVYDPGLYQRLFSKIDKSVFYEKEKI